MKSLKILILSLFILSCSTTNESTKSADGSPSYNSYSKTATLSALTRSLINEIKNEKKNLHKKQIYVPSKALIDEFKLVQISDQYFVKATLKINDEIDQTVLEAVGVKVEIKAGKNWKSLIPVNMLEDVANFSGVDNIQIDE